jgi:hypothetical protein
MFQNDVSNVSSQLYTYIACEYEIHLMLMLMIWDANAMLNT